ncbi:MFS transporter [Sphingomonas humi]|uniref:MFS transporter n=1 Tax=Sphingomonas humi TaxID=335630 RepID=A0ABP7RN38_9SPHN
MRDADTRNEFATGWKLLLACVAGVAFGSVGIAVYSIGAFVDPLGREFGWTRTEVTAALLFSSGLGGLAAPFIGALIERFGARPLALIGLTGVGAAFLLASRNNGSLPLFYLCFAVVATLGGGSGPISWTKAIASHFDRHRGLALAMALAGTGIIAILAPPYVTWLIERFGWRTAFVGVALLPLALALPLAVLFFKPAGDVLRAQTSSVERPGLTTGEAVRTYRFWVMLGSVLAMYLGIAGMIPNLIPALTDKGIARESAALAASAFGFSVIAGRITVGWLIDRLWAPGVAAVVLTPAAIGCLILMGDPSLALAITAAVLVGVAAGAELDLLAYLTTRYFGLRSYGKTYGLLYAGVAFAGGIGPLAFAALAERAGSYDVSFAVAAALFAIGGPAVLTLGRYPRLAD